MTARTSNRRALVITAMMAVSCLAYVFAEFLPQQRVIREMQQELEERRKVVMDADRLQPELQRVGDDVDRGQQRNAVWRAATPQTGRLTAVFERLTEAAELAQARVTRLEPQAADPLSTVSRIPLTVEVEGQFSAVCDFIGRLDRLAEPVWIEELQLEPIGATGESISGQLTLVIFAGNPEISDYFDSADNR